MEAVLKNSVHTRAPTTPAPERERVAVATTLAALQAGLPRPFSAFFGSNFRCAPCWRGVSVADRSPGQRR